VLLALALLAQPALPAAGGTSWRLTANQRTLLSAPRRAEGAALEGGGGPEVGVDIKVI
jgi:hypothetical protein